MEKNRLPTKKTTNSIFSLSSGFVWQKSRPLQDSGAAFGFLPQKSFDKSELIIDLRKNKAERDSQIFWKKIFSPSFVIRVTSLFLVFTFSYYSVISIGGTIAFFTDHEKSIANLFTSSDLGFDTSLYAPDAYRTQTQGGWGSKPRGDNPGSYLEHHFDLAFPDGLKIGTGTEKYAFFESSESIRNFLPSGGKASPFEKTHTNPSKTEAGVLAGQTLALALNIGFDKYDPNFGSGSFPLSGLYINTSDTACFGLNVGEVLAMANEILSGIEGPISPSEINECADEINNKFVDGENKGLIPGGTEWRKLTIENTGSLDMNYLLDIGGLNNPNPLCETLEIVAYLNEQKVYTGSLVIFNYESSLDKNQSDNWRLVFSLPDEAGNELGEQQCLFEYAIEGWQKNISIVGGGFSHKSFLNDAILSGSWEDSNSSKEENEDFNKASDKESDLEESSSKSNDSPPPKEENNPSDKDKNKKDKELPQEKENTKDDLEDNYLEEDLDKEEDNIKDNKDHDSDLEEVSDNNFIEEQENNETSSENQDQMIDDSNESKTKIEDNLSGEDENKKDEVLQQEEVSQDNFEDDPLSIEPNTKDEDINDDSVQDDGIEIVVNNNSTEKKGDTEASEEVSLEKDNLIDSGSENNDQETQDPEPTKDTETAPEPFVTNDNQEE